MEFTEQNLASFKYSGKDICVYSSQVQNCLKNYNRRSFKNYSSRIYYYWLNGQKPLPLPVVLRIMAEKSLKKVDIASFSIGSGNSIIPPIHDKTFFYFLGLLLGDGCLVHSLKSKSKNTYLIQISFVTKTEAEFGASLIRKLFDVKSSIYRGRGCYNLCTYSKPLVILLNSLYEIPLGKKYPSIKVPELVKASKQKEDIPFFLKGVFDSDGNIYRYRKGKSVQLRQHSEKFIRELHELFLKIGLDFRQPYYDRANDSWVLWSSKKELVDNFINKIIELKLEVLL